MALSILGTPGSTSAVDVDGTVTPYSAFTYTVSAGSNRVLFLFVCIGDDNLAEAVTSVTYGGQSMTSLWNVSDGNWTRHQCFYLKEAGIAAASSTTFAISTNGSADQLGLAAAAVQDAIQDATTFGTAVTNTGTGTSLSTGAISSASGEARYCQRHDRPHVDHAGGNDCGRSGKHRRRHRAQRAARRRRVDGDSDVDHGRQ
jgi:hypothetical protein